jgi:hypothetical protein
VTTVEVEFLGGPVCGRRQTLDALNGVPPDTHSIPMVAEPTAGDLRALGMASYLRHPSDRKDVAWLYVHEPLNLEKL